MAGDRTAFSASNCIKLLSLLRCALIAVLDRPGSRQLVITSDHNNVTARHEAPEIALCSLTRTGAVVIWLLLRCPGCRARRLATRACPVLVVYSVQLYHDSIHYSRPSRTATASPLEARGGALGSSATWSQLHPQGSWGLELSLWLSGRAPESGSEEQGPRGAMQHELTEVEVFANDSLTERAHHVTHCTHPLSARAKVEVDPVPAWGYGGQNLPPHHCPPFCVCAGPRPRSSTTDRKTVAWSCCHRCATVAAAVAAESVESVATANG